MKIRYCIRIAGFIFFLLSFLNGFVQDNKTIDSLKRKLKIAVEDSNKVKLLNALALQYISTDSIQLVKYRNQAYTISQRIHYLPGFYQYYRLLTVPAYMKARYAESEKFGRKQLQLALLGKDSTGILDASFFVLASMLYQQKSFKNEKHTIARLDSIPERFGCLSRIASLNHFLALYYFDQDPVLAKKYFKKEYQVLKKLNDPQILYVFYTDYTNFLLYQKEYKEAEKYARLCKDLAQQIKPVGGFGYLNATIALSVILMVNQKPQESNNIFGELRRIGDSIKNSIQLSEQRKQQLEIQRLKQFEENERKNLIILLVLLSATLLIFLIHRFLKEYQKQKEKKLKDKISMDLHDEIGSIINKSLLALKSLPESEKKRFEHIIENLQEGAINLREYVKNMSYNKTTLILLYDELLEFINTFVSSSNIEFNTQFKGVENYLIPADMARDIKLCIFESTNNMLKHAQASEFQLTLHLYEDDLMILFQDNGKLKNLDHLVGSGYGIRNIRNRVERNNGKVEFLINEAGSGLCIRMTFKISL